MDWNCVPTAQTILLLGPWHTIHKPVPKNSTRKPVPVSWGVSCNPKFDTNFFWYRNLVRVTALLYSVKETGTGFLVPVFGTGFWTVCHGPYVCTQPKFEYSMEDKVNAMILINNNDNKFVLRPFLRDNPGELPPEQSAVLDVMWPEAVLVTSHMHIFEVNLSARANYIFKSTRWHNITGTTHWRREDKQPPSRFYSGCPSCHNPLN